MKVLKILMNNPIKENPNNGRDTDVTIQLKRNLKNVLEDVFQSSRIFFEMQLVDQDDILMLLRLKSLSLLRFPHKFSPLTAINFLWY